ncbi:MAG TPA: GNAT family N-acetyltransferase [Chloroflexia bacterium]|nr:GNAT family N-acetyltransferase [Chloroflexia bacterium]
MKEFSATYKIENLSADDEQSWEVVGRLFEEAFPPEERRPIEALKAQVRKKQEEEQAKQTYFWVAKSGSKIVGLAFFELIPATGFAYLWFLAADARVRGQGVGTSLFQAMWQHLEQAATSLKLDFKGVVFEVDHPLSDEEAIAQKNRQRIHFYEKQGAVLLPLDFLAPPMWISSEHTEVLFRLMVKPTSAYQSQVNSLQFIEEAVVTILSASQLGYQQPSNSSYYKRAMDSAHLQIEGNPD